MPNTINSPNMNLPVPQAGVDPGPQWATDNNTCLSLIDSHDHSTGRGVPVTPAGLNINADLSMGSNNLTLIRTARFASQSAALALSTDLGCLYNVLGDLYYNDGSGNSVRLTQGGSIAGASGTITGLSAPASASYSSPTFTFQSDANIPANLDAGSVIIRNISSLSQGVTLSAPPALGSSYTLTLPLLPGSTTSILSVSTSGTMTALALTDKSLQISGSNFQIHAKSMGSDSSQGNIVVTSSVGSFSTSSTSNVSLASTTLTISGTRPIRLVLMPLSYIFGSGGPSTAASLSMSGGTGYLTFSTGGGVSSYSAVYAIPAGNHTGPIEVILAPANNSTFSVSASVSAGTLSVTNYALYVYEIY